MRWVSLVAWRYAMSEISQHEVFWEERRDLEDRRQQPARVLHHHGITGRRSLMRRKTDIFLLGTDHIEKPVWFAALAIIVLSVVDYVLTMYILDSGGSELNILMNYLVQQGSIVFFMTKYSLTALAVFILLAHHQHYFFRAIRVKMILYAIMFGYLSLFLYEIRIISNI